MTDARPAPAKAPVAAWALGLGGLIPFAGGAGLFVLGPPQLAGPGLLTLLTYGAVVLSFLGGVRWGGELSADRPDWRTLAASVAPSLIGWALLSLPLDQVQQLGGLILAYVAQWAWDARSGRLPSWYRRLRVVLTLGAVAALAAALAHVLAG